MRRGHVRLLSSIMCLHGRMSASTSANISTSDFNTDRVTLPATYKLQSRDLAKELKSDALRRRGGNRWPFGEEVHYLLRLIELNKDHMPRSCAIRFRQLVAAIERDRTVMVRSELLFEMLGMLTKTSIVLSEMTADEHRRDRAAITAQIIDRLARQSNYTTQYAIDVADMFISSDCRTMGVQSLAKLIDAASDRAQKHDAIKLDLLHRHACMMGDWPYVQSVIDAGRRSPAIDRYRVFVDIAMNGAEVPLPACELKFPQKMIDMDGVGECWTSP